MDARLLRWTVVLSAACSLGASHRSPNFVVEAPTPQIARQVAEAAEHYRVELAKEWLGSEMPNWHKPCTVRLKIGDYGAGGATTFAFDRGHVFGWRMTVQGPLDRILDSVLPHEISHTVFACYFRRPLPRWADEGAATLAEDDQEQRRQRRLLAEVMRNGRRIPLRQLLAIKEYPSDMQDVLTLYAEGFSLADFLVETSGKTRYLQFINCAHRHGWDQAVEQYYGFAGVDGLNKKWNSWIMAGSPRLNLPDGQQLAANDRRPRPSSAAGRETVIRSQTPDPEMPANVPLPAAAANGDRRPVAMPQRGRTTGDRNNSPNPRASARARAASDGWIPVTIAGASKRTPSAEPSQPGLRVLPSNSSPFGSDAAPAEPMFSADDVRPADFPQPNASLEDSGAMTGRSSNWADFPQRRHGLAANSGGSGRSGQASVLSFSP